MYVRLDLLNQCLDTQLHSTMTLVYNILIHNFLLKNHFFFFLFYFTLQEIGYTHMCIAEGVDSLLQLSGLLAKLCLKTHPQQVQ